MKVCTIYAAALFICLVLFMVSQGDCAWETGARIGYDSNVDRATNSSDAKSDSYLSGYLSYIKAPTGESRLNFAFDATLQATGYQRLSDLSYGQLTVSPALVYFVNPSWTITAAPFVQGRAVQDSDQSAFAYGGKLMMRQYIGRQFYLAEYYRYTDNRAKVDTYSYSENAFGALAGVNWTKNVFTEVSYEYSTGDSFFSLGASSVSVSGSTSGRRRGRNPTFSSTFDQTVVRENVDRHSGGILFGVDWTKSFFSTLGYTYTEWRGSDTAKGHSGALTLGYRF